MTLKMRGREKQEEKGIQRGQEGKGKKLAIEVLLLKQPLILPFLHKPTTTCQIDSCKASNSKLKPDLCNCELAKVIECTAPPQKPLKRGTNFLGHPAHVDTLFF